MKNLHKTVLFFIITAILSTNCVKPEEEISIDSISSFSYTTYLKSGKTEAIFTWSSVANRENYRFYVLEGTSITPGAAFNNRFTIFDTTLKIYDDDTNHVLEGGKTYSIIVEANFNNGDPIYTKPITLTIPAVKSTTSKLLSVIFTSNIGGDGAINPGFNSDIMEYTVTDIDENTTTLSITPNCSANATIKVDGTSYPKAQTTGGIGFPDNVRELSVEVTAEDGISKSRYRFIIYKGGENNPNLYNLEVSAGTLNFDPLIQNYTISFPSTDNSITITPTSVETVSKIMVGTEEVVSTGTTGTSNSIVFENEGDQKVISIVVTATGGATKTYNITAERGFAFTDFTEDFEGFSNGNDMRNAGWTIWNNDSDFEKWTISNYDDTNYASIMFNYEGNDDWLITPGLEIGAQLCKLRFKSRAGHASFLEDLEIYIYKDNDTSPGVGTSGNYTMIYSVKPVPYSLTEYTINIPAQYNGKIYIAFRYVSVDKFTLFIDDVIVEPQ